MIKIIKNKKNLYNEKIGWWRDYMIKRENDERIKN